MKPRDAGGASTSVIRRSATCRPAEPEARLGANTRACLLHTTVTRSAYKHTSRTCSRAHTEHGAFRSAWTLRHTGTDARPHVHPDCSNQRGQTRILQCTCRRPLSAFYLCAHVFSPRQSPSRSSPYPRSPLDPQFGPLSGVSPGFRGRAGGWSCGGGSGGYCEQTCGAGLRWVGVGSRSLGSCRGQALESPSLSWSAAVLRPWVLCHQGCYSRAPAPLRLLLRRCGSSELSTPPWWPRRPLRLTDRGRGG